MSPKAEVTFCSVCTLSVDSALVYLQLCLKRSRVPSCMHMLISYLVLMITFVTVW